MRIYPLAGMPLIKAQRHTHAHTHTNTRIHRLAGMPPIKGEKWVATKWIHQTPYQAVPSTPKPEESQADPFEDNVLTYTR